MRRQALVMYLWTPSLHLNMGKGCVALDQENIMARFL